MVLLKWTVRVVSGVASLLLVIVGNGILKEVGRSSGGPPGVAALGLACVLLASVLAFYIFFRWRLTRLKFFPEPGPSAGLVRRRVRTLGAILLGLAVLALAALFLVMASAAVRDEEGNAVFVIALLLSLGLGVIGVGVWKEAGWGRVAALLLGFLCFGAFPFGTLLAVYIWSVTSSPMKFAGATDSAVDEQTKPKTGGNGARRTVSLALLLAIAIPLFILGDVNDRKIGQATVWVVLVVTYVPTFLYLWRPAMAMPEIRLGPWNTPDWRFVPFYIAAILVSIAALRYILSE